MRGDYSNGRIYFIEPICEHEDNEFYYGSTLQKLSKRMDFHRGSYKTWKNGKRRKITCFDLFEKYGLENCKIYLVELYPCKSREELESREGYYIRNYDCVNKTIPGRTQKEYHNDNKEKIIQYRKEYCKLNKDKILEKNKEWRNNNKDKILKIKKEYYNNNKDKMNETHECKCGGKYTHQNKLKHFKTMKHIKYIEQNNEDDN